jgi:hypothetical protein
MKNPTQVKREFIVILIVTFIILVALSILPNKVENYLWGFFLGVFVYIGCVPYLFCIYLFDPWAWISQLSLDEKDDVFLASKYPMEFKLRYLLVIIAFEIGIYLLSVGVLFKDLPDSASILIIVLAIILEIINFFRNKKFIKQKKNVIASWQD